MNKARTTLTLKEKKQHALTSAANWYAQLCDEDVCASQIAAWQAWIAAKDSHQTEVTEQALLNQWAWQQVENLQESFQQLPREVSPKLFTESLTSVDKNFNQERRVAMRTFVAFIGITGIAGLGYRNEIAGQARVTLADQKTKTGEISTLNLPDGSEVTLNTNSAIDINFSSNERRIVLYQGEIMVKTTNAINAQFASAPFIVKTKHGSVEALGTRFSVRDVGDEVLVNVYQDTVRVTTSSGTKQLCSAGHSLRFNPIKISPNSPAILSDAWTSNMLVVSNMPLTDFINDVARYRVGVLRCQSSLNQYHISGVFNTQDTDQILRAIEKSFPVSIRRFTRYWVDISTTE